jgi:hypothetical protein
MIALHIFMDAEGMLKGRDPSKIIEAEKDISIGVLPAGMQSGLPSVSFGIDLPDGRTLFAETSYALFMAAAKAFAARYGWPGENQA